MEHINIALEERRTSEKVAALDERTQQITKTLDAIQRGFSESLSKQESLIVKLSTETRTQIMEHTIEEKEVWREFRLANDESHKTLRSEFDAKIDPLLTRVGTLEKKLWQYGGGLVVAIFVIENISTILRLFGK